MRNFPAFLHQRLPRTQADKEKAAEGTETKAKAPAKKAGAKKEKSEQEVVSLGPPGVGPNELVFGVCHIYASFNDTFVVRAL